MYLIIIHLALFLAYPDQLNDLQEVGDDDDHMIQSSLDTSPGLSRHSELRVV